MVPEDPLLTGILGSLGDNALFIAMPSMVFRAHGRGPDREVPFVVSGIHNLAEVLLLDVVKTCRSARGILGLGQCREQHGRQDGDDRDDHQQFNEGKAEGFIPQCFHWKARTKCAETVAYCVQFYKVFFLQMANLLT